MVDASELRLSATEYTEAEYQLAKLVAKEVPVDQDARLIFFAEVERCEERVRAVSTREPGFRPSTTVHRRIERAFH